MQPKLIRNEADYNASLAHIEDIFRAKPGTLEGDELDLLVTLVELYEEKVYRINLPDPISAIRFRNLVNGLGIPAGILLQEPGAKLASDAVLEQDRQFPKTPNGSPVVALTLGYDRLDNFWFTLSHELAYVAMHLDKDDVEAFFDDLTECERKDKYESEADKLASKTLIPENEWKSVQLSTKLLPKTVMAFAEKLRISPAIPAGRIRFKNKDYSVFKQLTHAHPHH